MLGGAVRVANSSSTSSFIINLGSVGVGSFRAGYLFGDGTNMELNNQNNGSLSLLSNNTERLGIKSTGDVEIYGPMRVGKNSSTSEYIINLETNGVGDTRSGYINGDGSNLEINNQQNGDFITSTNNAERMRVKSNGEIQLGSKVAINTTVFDAMLEIKLVNNGTNAIRFIDADSVIMGSIYRNGFGGTFYATTSDERAKQDITDYQENMIEKIKKVKVKK